MVMLTIKQARMHNWIAGFINDNGFSPTVVEISVEFGVSTGAVHQMLFYIEKKGYLSRTPHTARSLKCTKPRVKVVTPRVKVVALGVKVVAPVVTPRYKKPADAEVLHNGMYYKRGVHGKVFWRGVDEWFLSDATLAEFKQWSNES